MMDRRGSNRSERARTVTESATAAPAGFNFVGSPAGKTARLVFGYHDPRDDPAFKSDVYTVEATLGARISLGAFSYSAGSGISATGFAPKLLLWYVVDHV